MKVLFVNDHATLAGGAETLISVLGRELMRSGDEIFLLAPDIRATERKTTAGTTTGTERTAGEGSDGLILPRDRIIFTREKKGALSRMRNAAAGKDVLEAVRRYDIDVVHAHNIFSRISPFFLYRLGKAGIPAVMTLHDYHLLCPKTTYFPREAKRLCPAVVDPGKCDMRRCLGGAKYLYEITKRKRWERYLRGVRFIAPSHYLAKVMKRGGVENVSVVHNGIDLPALKGTIQQKEKKEEKENKSETKEDRTFRLLFCGRLYPEKGVMPMLEGFERFLGKLGGTGEKDVAGGNEGDGERAGIGLTITGSGTLENEVRKMTRRVPKMEYLGFVARDRLLSEMRSSDHLILPSLWPENCSMAVLEAMSLGVPPIASNLGGTPELVRDGKEGYLMDLEKLVFGKDARWEDDAAEEVARTLERAYSEREGRKKMAMRCRKRGEERFSVEVMAKKVRGIYSSLN